MISLISAIFCSITAATDLPVKQYYSFHLVLEENFAAILIRFVTTQLIFYYQFGFTCLVAVMCGTLYYSLSELFHLFKKDLQAAAVDSKNMRVKLLHYAKLFKLANELEKTLSTTCCLFLCSQMISMYVGCRAYNSDNSMGKRSSYFFDSCLYYRSNILCFENNLADQKLRYLPSVAS
ncbi:hypothetical protein TNCV_199151 [Trichonephila clavipes]|nr:hypothetical protein TNCV_199151 [Trichonephila clavipes]